METAWIEGVAAAQWASEPGHRGAASGSSRLEIPAGCLLPRHTDSAEEVVVVTDGEVVVRTEDEPPRPASVGEAVVIPADVPHAVENRGKGVARFVAVYAAADVVTTYEQPVQPAGRRERSPLG